MTSATLLGEGQWQMANVGIEINVDFVETTHYSLNTLGCNATWH